MVLTPEQYERIEAAFSDACEVPPARRTAFLSERCGDDPLVRAEVEAMLAADERATQALSPTSLPRPSADTIIDGNAVQRAASIPERIGSYRILRECGHGGMGVVYEAEQESPKRRVALKVIRTGLVSTATLKRFQHETEVLGRLQHPGIAQIFAAGSSADGSDDASRPGEGSGQPFIAMEFVDGPDLLNYASRHSLDTAARLALFALVCDAVHHAHERGVIHRDLKPANILVVPPGLATADQAPQAPTDGVGQPKILDFGVARMTDAATQWKTMLTNAGQLIGTLQYMSPEQASEGTMPIDARSDIYSLGVVLYELLVGRPPHDFARLSIPESVVAIRKEEATRLGSLDPSLTGDVETIVGKCLEKDPGHRYQRAAELAEDIRRHLRSEPIAARPPSTWYQVRKFVRRNRALVGGAVATVVALVIGLVTALAFAFRANENAELAAASETRALRRAYVANLTAAAALTETDPLLARAQLEAAPAGMRGWEHRYLSSQLQRHSRTFEESRIAPGPLAAVKGSVDIGVLPGKDELVAALDDGRIGVWDLESTELLRVGTELAGTTVRSLDVAPSGRPRVACGTWDGRVRVWDLENDRWLAVADREEPIWFVAWDAPGTRLLFATSTTVGLWQEGQPVREHAVADPIDRDYPGAEAWELRHERLKHLSFTSGGDRFVATVRSNNMFPCWIWDAATGERLDPTSRNADEADTINKQLVRATSAASHDGARIAHTLGLRSAIVRNAATLDEHFVLRGHRRAVWRIAWTDDDARIVTSSYDGTLRVWRADDGTAIDVVKSDKASPLAITGGREGIAYRADGVLRYWNFGAAETVLRPDVSFVYALTYSPDGRRLAAASKYSHHVTVIDPSDGRTVSRTDLGGPSHGLCFSPDSKQVYGRSLVRPDDREPRVTPYVPVSEWPVEHRGGVREMNGRVISPDGMLLAESSAHGQIAGTSAIVRNLTTGETVLELEGRYWGLAFSPDSKLLAATLEYPGRIEIWNLERKEMVVSLLAHDEHVYCVAFHPDGSRIASGGNDNTIRLWDTATWEPVFELHGHTSYVMALDFSPDGTQLASGSGDLTVRIWDSMPRSERRR